VRAGLSDTAIFLYLAKDLIEREAYDSDFVVKFTDLPLLIRTDTLTRLRADEVFAGYEGGLDPAGPSYTIHGLTEEQYALLGDRVVMDASGEPVALNRE